MARGTRSTGRMAAGSEGRDRADRSRSATDSSDSVRLPSWHAAAEKRRTTTWVTCCNFMLAKCLSVVHHEVHEQAVNAIVLAGIALVGEVRELSHEVLEDAIIAGPLEALVGSAATEIRIGQRGQRGVGSHVAVGQPHVGRMKDSLVVSTQSRAQRDSETVAVEAGGTIARVVAQHEDLLVAPMVDDPKR